jgi:hypothetical protein
MEQLKLVIRQQVKAEEKTSLSDDIFVAAYCQHGSIRQAAAFLSQQTGQDVSKDQVHRALQLGARGGDTEVVGGSRVSRFPIGSRSVRVISQSRHAGRRVKAVRHITRQSPVVLAMGSR